MPALLFTLPQQVALDTVGVPVPGARLYTYAAGTLTERDTYTTIDLDVAHDNPVIADAAGRFDPIFLDSSLAYRVILKDSNDVEIYDEDEINDTALRAPFYDTTDAEAAAGVTPDDKSLDEGTWDRYEDPENDLPAVWNQMNAPRVNKQNYFDGDDILLGSPKNSSFGTDETAIQKALDLAEHMGKAVRVTGSWTGLFQQSTDPAGDGRACAIYLPSTVSLLGSGKNNTNFNLAAGADCQLIAWKDPDTGGPYTATIAHLTFSGNRSNQTSAGGGPLVDWQPTSNNSRNYFLMMDVRIRSAYGVALKYGVDMNGSMLNGIWVYDTGVTGSSESAVEFSVGDLQVLNLDCGQSQGRGIRLPGSGTFIGLKSWRAGQTDATNGHGFYMSGGASGLQFIGWAQDCAGDGAQLFSTSASYGNQIWLRTDSCAGIGLQVGGNVFNSDITVMAKDRSGGAYSHDYAFQWNGSGMTRNRIRVYVDDTVAAYDPTDDGFADNPSNDVLFDEMSRTFAAADATPSVAGCTTFVTDTSAYTITDFDNGQTGQKITVISGGATTFDTTGTNLSGSSVDIVTAAGDMTEWLCVDGTTWRLLGFVDVSADNSGGA